MTCFVPSGTWNIHHVPVYNPNATVKTVRVLVSDQNGAVKIITIVVTPKNFTTFDAQYTYALLDES